MRRGLLALVALTVLLAACGDDSTATTTTSVATTIETTTTTEVATTIETATTTMAATTTTLPAATTTMAATTTTLPAATPSGSGCTPPGDVLPNGDWFGFIEGVTDVAGVTHLTFDLACYYEGAEADLAAAADGKSVPLEFYPYVRNKNPKVFDLTLTASAVVEVWNPGPVFIAFAAWVAGLGAEDGCSAATGYSACPAWVKIVGGNVEEIYGFLPEWGGDGRGS